MSRPEHIKPPELFYDGPEAAKYGGNSRMITIQTNMAERCLELAKVEPHSGKAILDIGCGSGISGEVLSDHGHYWVGMDISPHMLLVALERETEGDLMLTDIGQGFKFRAGVFDACISVSVLQWLCNADRKGVSPWHRCNRFFQSLFNCLVRGGRAVLQFYPETAAQIEMITAAAMKCGFSGGLVVDFPHSAKAKKYFLVLTAGSGEASEGKTVEDLTSLAKTGADGREEEDGGSDMEVDSASDKSDEERSEKGAERKTIQVEKSLNKAALKKKNKGPSGGQLRREWIHKKKEQYRQKGKEVKKDSKFTGRKRKPKF